MKKINFNALFPLVALVALVTALSQQMSGVPPLGSLLDPFVGAVQNEREQGAVMANGMKGGLKEQVNVFFDERSVPHIYAKNTEDLYFAQGYVTAYYRLWQMDFLSFVSAGRLSEIFADGYLEHDRYQRRIGMLEAAKRSLVMIEQDAETKKIIDAYTKGVNAYIHQLAYKNMPLEYKLLDYAPEDWSNLKTVLVMKSMANTLSGYEEDYPMSNMMLALGEEKFNKLFPDFQKPVSPVMNDSSGKINPAMAYIKKPDYLDYSFFSTRPTIADNSYNPQLGSNSWAVSGKKTRSGYPILCNDPHLNLTLPAVWMEMQLNCPGMNVYGVTIPGAPAIIIGFNENIAWGLTNGADDVKDWYKLKITGNYKKYELDAQWRDMGFVVEEIKRRGQRPLLDTVYYTVHGPIVYDKQFIGRHPEMKDYALRWEMHKPSNEFLTFIKLNRAGNYNEYKNAIANYSCPAQNFTFAGKDNTIAVNHQGKMPVKWAGGGRFLLDGTNSAYLYPSYIPQDSLPYTLNPDCNFVLSANQHPTGAGYAYYYNGYYSETRANRIRTLLQSQDVLDAEKMKAMQLDNTNPFAADALPILIKYVDQNKLTDKQKQTLGALSTWKANYDLDNVNAKLFDLWWRNIKDYTFDEFNQFSFSARTPADYVFLNIIQNEPGNDYFDKDGTPAKESAIDIVHTAFVNAAAAYDELKKHGGVQWGSLNKVNVMHLTNVSAFSRMGLASAGHPQAINATSGSWGPGWRMIVELGQRPKAYGVYAGGQSGNIASRHYDEFIDHWNKNQYYQLMFFMSEAEAKAQAKNNWEIK